MRVRTEQQVARRAMVIRRFLRSVPRRQCIEVSLFWLGAYGLVAGLVGAVVSLPWLCAFAQWSVTHSR